MKNLNKISAVVGFVGAVLIAMIAYFDSAAEDMMSAVVVQLFFVSLFISGYISMNLKK